MLSACVIAGISISEGGPLGADADGEKNFRDIALWIGRKLGQKSKLGLKVGAWGVNMLLSLPVFTLDASDVLKMTASASRLLGERVVYRLTYK